MARIRTIKPDFFTSEDIVALSPLARLLYVALWCEADKEGRMVWKPYTFKLRYLPGDACDIHALCKEITDRGLVVLYGDGFAYIPKFAQHQHINPRESTSVLPDPTGGSNTNTRPARDVDASARVDDASARVPHAQGGREGKGREGNVCVSAPACVPEAAPPPTPPPQAANAATHTFFSAEYREDIKTARPDLNPDAVWAAFCEHYRPDKRGRMRWRKWIEAERRSAVPGVDLAGPPSVSDPDSKASVEAVALSRGMQRWDALLEPWSSYKFRVKTACQSTVLQ